MKKIQQIVMITVLLLATVSVLGVAFIRNYEKGGALTSDSTSETENDVAMKPDDNIETTEDVDDTEIIEDTEVEEPPLEFMPSDISYFDDALFIGDSRVHGIFCYGTFENATFFAEDGMDLYGLWGEKLSVNGYGRTTLEGLLNARSYSKIYIMMGLNELGEPQDKTAQEYKEALDKIHELEPDAIIYVCSNLHVSEKQSSKDKTYNNRNIDSFNEKIKAFTDHETFFYLDVNQMFNDEAGNLEAKYTWDNVHIYGKYYDEWCQWFCQNTIQKPDGM